MTETTRTDSWATCPAGLRYLVLGEEGDEDLMISGHGLAEPGIREAVTHAGFGRVFDDLEFEGHKIADGATVADLLKVETWAREVRGCPRHRWLPWWLRHGVTGSVDWVRWQVFRVLWRTWWRGRDPLDLPRVPGWLLWLGRHWRAFSGCSKCEYVDHYRICDGCGFCSSDGTGKAPPWWDWSAPAGDPAANEGRSGYFPVTVIDLEG